MYSRAWRRCAGSSSASANGSTKVSNRVSIPSNISGGTSASSNRASYRRSMLSSIPGRVPDENYWCKRNYTKRKLGYSRNNELRINLHRGNECINVIGVLGLVHETSQLAFDPVSPFLDQVLQPWSEQLGGL